MPMVYCLAGAAAVLEAASEEVLSPAALDAAVDAAALEAALPPQAVKVDAASKTASAERMVVFFMEMPSFF